MYALDLSINGTQQKDGKVDSGTESSLNSSTELSTTTQNAASPPLPTLPPLQPPLPLFNYYNTWLLNALSIASLGNSLELFPPPPPPPPSLPAPPPVAPVTTYEAKALDLVMKSPKNTSVANLNSSQLSVDSQSTNEQGEWRKLHFNTKIHHVKCKPIIYS